MKPSNQGMMNKKKVMVWRCDLLRPRRLVAGPTVSTLDILPPYYYNRSFPDRATEVAATFAKSPYGD